MSEQVLSVVMRYLHIVSAVVAVGGLAFLLMCFSPAIRLLEDSLRQSVYKLAHDRFLRVLWFAIGGLTVSGIYNWYMNAEAYRRLGPIGNALIGTKALLAVIIFTLVIARSAGLIQPRNPRLLPMINIHLAALVMLLATILRVLRG